MSRPRLRRSASTASATPGYCTLTATSRPSRVTARWTWPIEAAASGSGSMVAKASPTSASMSLRSFANGTLGAASRSSASLALNSSRRASGTASRSRVESTWPNFMATPFIDPSVATSWSAACMARSSGSPRPVAQRRPWPAAIPPRRALRPRREDGMRGTHRGYAGPPVSPRPLLAVDRPNLLFRAFFALPRSITGPDDRPVNALLGTANLILQAVERYDPRAIVLCDGAEAAVYRKELLPRYHADRPELDPDLAHQFADSVAFFDAFGWETVLHDTLEADDLLGSYALEETEAGGEALLFTGDRDMFQCVGERVRVLFPSGSAKGGPEEMGEREVSKRYGIPPALVPDFIALRGDPSDGIPGGTGIGEKTAKELLLDHGSLEGAMANAVRERPRVQKALREEAGLLRQYK